MSEPSWPNVLAHIERACVSFGFDLVHPFAAADYNEHTLARERLFDFGRARALALLIGNSRALWPYFVTAREAPELAALANPLDAYVEASLASALAHVGQLNSRSYFAHVTSPRALPIQRLAELVGFAARGPSHLVVHPEHGPWLALRAVVVLDVEGPAQQPQPPQRPCHGCAQPCVPALQAALRASGPSLDASSIAAHAAAWIAVRDACPVGRDSRYGEQQLRYHYGVERSRLTDRSPGSD